MTELNRFKIRIWDKETKKYHNGLTIFNYMRGVTNTDRYLLEQCTGIKDKQGNFVFEGDIIEKPSGEKFSIVWDEKSASFRENDTKEYSIYNGGHWLTLWGDDYKNNIIIGNIHQGDSNDRF